MWMSKPPRSLFVMGGGKASYALLSFVDGGFTSDLPSGFFSLGCCINNGMFVGVVVFGVDLTLKVGLLTNLQEETCIRRELGPCFVVVVRLSGW